MYPFSVSDLPRTEHDILGILIGDLTYKITPLLLTPLSDCKQYTEDCWLFYSEN